MLTMVLGGKESNGSVEEQAGEDFCEPSSKQRKESGPDSATRATEYCINAAGGDDCRPT